MVLVSLKCLLKNDLPSSNINFHQNPLISCTKLVPFFQMCGASSLRFDIFKLLKLNKPYSSHTFKKSTTIKPLIKQGEMRIINSVDYESGNWVSVETIF